MNADNPLLRQLATRRSAKIADLKAPGPTATQLEQILTIAARVPDHKRVVPWRFVVFEGEARAAFGEVLADVVVRESAEVPSPVRLDTERKRFLQAPLVVALIFRHVPTPGAPELEQLMSCGAAGMNLVHAAHALGYGANWVTGWAAFSPGVHAALKLAPHEKIAGFIHIGTPGQPQEERPRPGLGEVVSHWQA